MLFNSSRRRLALGFLCTTGLVLGTAAVADADVIFSDQGTLPPPREQIQFNDDDLVLNGNSIQGITNQSDTVINFDGDESLRTQGRGQSRIEAEDGGFTTLTVDPEGDLTFFTGLSFNLNAVEDGEVTITANTTTGSESATFDLRRPGSNRFILTAINDQMITSVDISSTVDLADARQFRIKGIGIIPEPASLSLLSLGGLLALRRRR